ncbi:MAG: ABC transporter permease [Firmicutes bacterium HGW-Firmicutes-16]|nr:MAG: ABC transporter permease [Firmicutes bacterium HGW-Firmicutes-16]
MNMYLHELKSLGKSTLIWACSILAIAVIYFSLYPGIVKDAADFKSLLSGYPAEIRAMLGISLDNITTILGYYSMIFSFVAICGAIQATNYGLSTLSKEARERTADFLLVKPVSRASIVTSKLLAALTMLLATNVLYFIGAFVTANLVKTSDYNVKLFFLVSLTLLFLQLIFFALGAFISVFFKKLKSVLPISLGVVFGLYILGAVLVTGEDDVARFISPFQYFNIGYILNNAGYESTYMITGALIVAVTIAASYIIYVKKDIHAVN